MGDTGSATDLGNSVSGLVHLDVDEYLELFIYHSDGSAEPVIGNSQRTFMTVHLVGVE